MGDTYALEKAKQTFERKIIKLYPNPYFEDIKDKKKDLNKEDIFENNDLLYLCEPINNQNEKMFKPEFTPNYNESDALHYFIKRLEESKIIFDNIIIRPHPSEKKEKYISIKEKFKNINISLSKETELIHDIIQSKYVFGCQTTAMVVALILGKEVISCIPPEGFPKNVLPHKEILNLNEWIENQKE